MVVGEAKRINAMNVSDLLHASDCEWLFIERISQFNGINFKNNVHMTNAPIKTNAI